MGGNDTFGFILPLVLMFAIFYFLLIRPQQKRQKERNNMLNSLQKGDQVITIGGLHGTIVDLTEERVTLKVADNVRLVFERAAVNGVINKEEGMHRKRNDDSKSNCLFNFIPIHKKGCRQEGFSSWLHPFFNAVDSGLPR